MGESILNLNSLPICVLHRVFNKLSPRDLCRASAVCRLWRTLNIDAVGEDRWKRLYSNRWPLNRVQNTKLSPWCDIYRQKMLQSSAWHGKYIPDALIGHKAAVRSIQILPQYNLLASGSVDRTVKLWDLSGGMLISSSRLHDNTVRSLLLESSPYDDSVSLFSGSDSIIRYWKFKPSAKIKEFEKPIKLKAHTGPVSCLGSSRQILYSGSWDCSVCLWQKQTGRLESRFVFQDWIWAINVKETRFIVACGKKALVQDIEYGKTTNTLDTSLEEGHVTSCEATEDMRYAFTGLTDGFVTLYDLRSRNQSFEIAHHTSGVTDLSFENPYIAASSLDGTISLTNLESRLHPTLAFKKNTNGTNRQLSCPGGSVYCVHMTNQWLACGAENPIVRTWDFTRAIEEAKKAEFLRSYRKNRRINHFTEKSIDYKVKPIFEQETDSNFNYKGLVEKNCRIRHQEQQEQQQQQQQQSSATTAHWNSFGRGDSTDESEIIEVFG